MKKQLKITKLFRKGAVPQRSDVNEELLAEIEQLEKQLKERQDELFQLQRSSYRHKFVPPKKKCEAIIRPTKIIASSSVKALTEDMQQLSMLTGMEVESYSENDHCSIVFHLQHESQHEVKHRLSIVSRNGGYEVLSTALPLGFNLAAVRATFTNVMQPQFLVSVRRALVAYYDRLDQFEMLKKMLKSEAELFKLVDGSHMEVTFEARSEHNPEQSPFSLTLLLDYTVYSVRVKQCSFLGNDLPEGALDTLTSQCSVFKRKPLHKAFRQAFIQGNGAYIMVRQDDVPQQSRRAVHSRPQHNNDDTYRPEQATESDESEQDD